MFFKRTKLLLFVFVCFVPIEAKLSFRTSASLTTIKSVLGPKAHSKTDLIKEYADKNIEPIEEITSVIDTVGESLPKITSGETLNVVSGALDIMSTATSLIPVVGPIVSSVFSLLSMVFGSIGGVGEKKDIGTVVSKEIYKVLNKYDDNQLRANAYGTARVYRLSQAYLKSKEKYILQKHEVAALSANVPIYSGVKFLGFLQTKILENTNSKEEMQVKRAMEYTNLYVILATFRSIVLWQLYSVVKGVEHSSWTANGIRNVVKSEEAADKKFMQFVVNPEYGRAVFHSVFYPSQWPIIMKFLAFNGLKMQQLTRDNNYPKQSLHNQKYPYWAMVMRIQTSQLRLVFVGPTKGLKSLFYIDPKSSLDQIFYIRSVEWPEWYVTMDAGKEGFCFGKKGKPGPQGEFKFIRYPDGKYLISSAKWKDKFLFHDDRYWVNLVGAWKGDPGKRGHWTFMTHILANG